MHSVLVDAPEQPHLIARMAMPESANHTSTKVIALPLALGQHIPIPLQSHAWIAAVCAPESAQARLPVTVYSALITGTAKSASRNVLLERTPMTIIHVGHAILNVKELALALSQLNAAHQMT